MGPLDRAAQPWSGQAVNYYFFGAAYRCCLYAFVAGGGPERIGAAVYALACIVTSPRLSAPPIKYRSVEAGVFIVDVLVFCAFSVLALRANRFWPIWVSGLLGLGVLAHLATMGWPERHPVGLPSGDVDLELSDSRAHCDRHVESSTAGQARQGRSVLDEFPRSIGIALGTITPDHRTQATSHAIQHLSNCRVGGSEEPPDRDHPAAWQEGGLDRDAATLPGQAVLFP